MRVSEHASEQMSAMERLVKANMPMRELRVVSTRFLPHVHLSLLFPYLSAHALFLPSRGKFTLERGKEREQGVKVNH